MKKICGAALVFWMALSISAYAFDGSGFDADGDGDIDAADLAQFAQYYGTLGYYKDYDGDGYSDGTVQYAQAQPIDYYPESELTAVTGDCDDAAYSINPGVQEICADGIDNDCDGVIDESECLSNQTFTVDWAILIYPVSAQAVSGTSIYVYGQVYVSGLTDQTMGCDPHPVLVAQVGIGSTPDTANMTWTTAECNLNYNGYSNNDEYVGIITAGTAGTYYYGCRFSGDGGNTWQYADLNGLLSGGSVFPNPGHLVVTPESE